jgi:hypothetical protein
MRVIERAADGTIVGKEEYLVREPAERLFVENRWVEGVVPRARFDSDDHRQFAAFQRIVDDWVSWRDAQGRRAFTLPVANCSTDAEVVELDRMSAATWLRARHLDSKPLRWWLEYGCRDDYGCTLDTTSAWALLFYHAARLDRAGARSAPFLTWPEGNGRIVRHLEQVVGERLLTSRMVLDVHPDAGEIKVAVLDSATQRLQVISAQHVILATPSFLVPHLLRPYRETPPAHYEAFSYSPWAVANLHLKRRPKNTGYSPSWDNVVYGGASLGYVDATHQTLDDDGPSVWTYYQPLVDADPTAARHRLAAASQPAMWDAIAAELAAPHPDLDAAVSRLDVWQFGHAMIRPVPGVITGVAIRKAAEPFGSVHFAHSDLSGVALLDEAHYHGVRAAEEVLGAIRRQK